MKASRLRVFLLASVHNLGRTIKHKCKLIGLGSTWFNVWWCEKYGA